MSITRLGLSKSSFESYSLIYSIYHILHLKPCRIVLYPIKAYKAEKKRITSQGESEAAQLREENEKLRRELEDAKQQVKGSYDLFLSRNR